MPSAHAAATAPARPAPAPSVFHRARARRHAERVRMAIPRSQRKDTRCPLTRRPPATPNWCTGGRRWRTSWWGRRPWTRCRDPPWCSRSGGSRLCREHHPVVHAMSCSFPKIQHAQRCYSMGDAVVLVGKYDVDIPTDMRGSGHAPGPLAPPPCRWLHPVHRASRGLRALGAARPNAAWTGGAGWGRVGRERGARGEDAGQAVCGRLEGLSLSWLTRVPR